MKKIAHICTASIMHKLLVDKLALLQRDYEIHLISSKEGYNDALMSQYVIPLKFVNMNRQIHLLDDLRSIYSLTKLLKKEKYDIAHTHNAKAGIIGRIAGRLARVPVVIHTIHGLLLPRAKQSEILPILAN